MQSRFLKIVVLFVCLLYFTDCKTIDLSYIELQKANPTHDIISKDLIKTIEDVLKDDDNFIGIDSQIIIVYIIKKDDDFHVCVSRTNFNIFKRYRPDLFDDLKGYSTYELIPVLIFGDVNNDFYKRSDAKLYNVLGELPKYDLGFPPIIYEPRMICTEMKI